MMPRIQCLALLKQLEEENKALSDEVEAQRRELVFASKMQNQSVAYIRKLEKAVSHLNWIEIETRDQVSPGSAKRVNVVARAALKEINDGKL